MWAGQRSRYVTPERERERAMHRQQRLTEHLTSELQANYVRWRSERGEARVVSCNNTYKRGRIHVDARPRSG